MTREASREKENKKCKDLKVEREDFSFCQHTNLPRKIGRYIHDLRRGCSWREAAVGNQHWDADVTSSPAGSEELLAWLPRERRAYICQISLLLHTYLRTYPSEIKVVCWTGLLHVNLRLFLHSLYIANIQVITLCELIISKRYCHCFRTCLDVLIFSRYHMFLLVISNIWGFLRFQPQPGVGIQS